MAYSSLSVGNAFIEIANQHNKKLNQIQLQQLVFFAHGYTLAFLNRNLLNEEVNVWTFGAVIKPLYETLRPALLKNGVIPNVIPDQPTIPKTSEEFKIIEKVYEAYGIFNRKELTDIAFNIGSPCSQIWEKEPFGTVPNHKIRNYYLKLI